MTALTNNGDGRVEAVRILRLALGATPKESIREAAARVALHEPKGTRRHLIAREVLFGEGDDVAVFFRAAAMAPPTVVGEGGRR